jgi:hypothetical protein
MTEQEIRDREMAHNAGMLSNEVMRVVMQEPNASVALTALVSALSIVVNVMQLDHEATVDVLRKAMEEARQRIVPETEH